MDYPWSIPLRPDALRPDTMVWTLVKAGLQSTSPYAGSTESVVFPGWYWRISITLPARLSDNGGELEGFLERLAGGANVVLISHWLRPVPRGTMRGMPSISVPGARGDTTISIATAGTLMAGDLFGVGNRVYKAADSCVAVAGVLTVPITSTVDRTLQAGAAVLWNAPTVRCIIPSMTHSSAYQAGGIMASTPLDLMETI